jgi:hypothetical protein
VVARRQLLGLGLSSDEVTRRIGAGRLHAVFRGVYAVGRPGLTNYGRWMAAVLACGPHAVASHGAAAAIWDFGRERYRVSEVSIPRMVRRRRPGIVIHGRRTLTPAECTTRHNIPVTTPPAP